MTAPSEIDAALKRIESGWRVQYIMGRYQVRRASPTGWKWLGIETANAKVARAEYLRLSAREE
jgi:hypothetical protein